MKRYILAALMVAQPMLHAEIENPASAPTNMDAIRQVYSPENVARAQREGLVLSPNPMATPQEQPAPEVETAPAVEAEPAAPTAEAAPTEPAAEPVVAPKAKTVAPTETVTETTVVQEEPASPEEQEFLFDEEEFVEEPFDDFPAE